MVTIEEANLECIEDKLGPTQEWKEVNGKTYVHTSVPNLD